MWVAPFPGSFRGSWIGPRSGSPARESSRHTGWLCMEIWITTTKDSPPATWSKIIFTLEADVVITNLKVLPFIASRKQAYCLLHIHRKQTLLLPLSVKTVTPSATTKAHKATFSDGQEPLQFSDIIYYIVQ